jgi:hypothetical protein
LASLTVFEEVREHARSLALCEGIVEEWVSLEAYSATAGILHKVLVFGVYVIACSDLKGSS